MPAPHCPALLQRRRPCGVQSMCRRHGSRPRHRPVRAVPVCTRLWNLLGQGRHALPIWNGLCFHLLLQQCNWAVHSMLASWLSTVRRWCATWRMLRVPARLLGRLMAHQRATVPRQPTDCPRPVVGLAPKGTHRVQTMHRHQLLGVRDQLRHRLRALRRWLFSRSHDKAVQGGGWLLLAGGLHVRVGSFMPAGWPPRLCVVHGDRWPCIPPSPPLSPPQCTEPDGALYETCAPTPAAASAPAPAPAAA